jgi:heme/copper-type cytochrome/quinol oxidase subunit 2
MRVLVVAGVSLLALLVLLAPWPILPAAGGEREIVIRARQYAFEPGVVRVNRGDRITMILEAEDLTHGLRLDGYDVDLVAVPGQRARTSFVADRPGKFQMRCSKVCGTLHPFMLGELVVEPHGAFWRAAALALLAAVGTVLFVVLGRRTPAGE